MISKSSARFGNSCRWASGPCGSPALRPGGVSCVQSAFVLSDVEVENSQVSPTGSAKTRLIAGVNLGTSADRACKSGLLRYS